MKIPNTGKPVSNKVAPLPKSIKISFDQISRQQVIDEGNLLKYKPGMMRDPYIERWCRLTKDSFKVFSGN